ncbi:MAG: SMP-30/gluconolactonase/LRE family protein [Pseudomonadota bacterium]
MLLAWCGGAQADDKLFDSRQITPSGEYTFGIEGPAVDANGALFVVNFNKPGSIGRLAPGAPQSELFTALPDGSVGNAIRFDRAGTMLIADYKKHTIFAIAPGATVPVPLFASDRFNQPNDLTVAADGTLYASDPNWKGRSGQVWRITREPDGTARGEVMTAPRAMGTTNGIDLSPDGRTLYVGESGTGQIWAYGVNGNALTNARLVTTFAPDTIDGLRTDASGRLLVARILRGAIAIVAPDGKQVGEVALQGKEPTNLAFGGADGRTVFVTQRKGGYIESFRTDREGREHCLLTGRCR